MIGIIFGHKFQYIFLECTTLAYKPAQRLSHTLHFAYHMNLHFGFFVFAISARQQVDAGIKALEAGRRAG